MVILPICHQTELRATEHAPNPRAKFKPEPYNSRNVPVAEFREGYLAAIGNDFNRAG
jgi:hypothetical protein